MRAKQIIGDAEFNYQPFQRLFMIFDAAVSKNVFYFQPLLKQAAGDQNRSMAVERFLLCAHKRDAIFFRSLPYAFYALFENFGLSQEIVLNLAVPIATGVVRPRTQLLPKKDIFDVCRPKSVLQSFPIELWIDTAIGTRTDVTNRSDMGSLKKLYEFLDRVR